MIEVQSTLEFPSQHHSWLLFTPGKPLPQPESGSPLIHNPQLSLHLPWKMEHNPNNHLLLFQRAHFSALKSQGETGS